MRIVVLVSGSGTNLQAVIDAVQGGELDLEIAAVGSEVPDCGGLVRATTAQIPTFAVPLVKGGDRSAWNMELADAVRAHTPDLVVSSGFMRILGTEFLANAGAAIINTHPALLPSFPGAHAVRDALAHGVKVTGCTVHQVDAGVDTGPILAQEAVRVREDDDQDSLHERIKVHERRLLVDTLAGISSGTITVG
ncbi:MULTISPECIES: phosphoribosylglycinamide formyltransferase [unclassified Nesterenkonia]|uniref:phosphoribosylglycinamide formyltransferase n=1 Tax=unclassified Nesterenkonia TaxID=2629769 RepID=UPI001F4CB1FE|nr:MULTISPECIES: phosphoribosylglycinamide formyltransferase [unclassified Nesterenkonia]MCH8560644.1 phosphoribosylglycinamide formyltransferase [Nesterenkonia sp. DZ6]MCH8562922.1 phosphoribosylglycinamide formyltransferase [Nesterenkonia sp. YGD6]MCH8570752.1 phosphoribosylglycinamide formyltransferase [Nesterenkonia sp. AY15]